MCGGGCEGVKPSTLKVTSARLWRGHQGRRRAQQQRRWKRCLQLQRWWRSAKLRKRLVAKQRILRWLPGCIGDGMWDGMEILGNASEWLILAPIFCRAYHFATPECQLIGKETVGGT